MGTTWVSFAPVLVPVAFTVTAVCAIKDYKANATAWEQYTELLNTKFNEWTIGEDDNSEE